MSDTLYAELAADSSSMGRRGVISDAMDHSRHHQDQAARRRGDGEGRVERLRGGTTAGCSRARQPWLRGHSHEESPSDASGSQQRTRLGMSARRRTAPLLRRNKSSTGGLVFLLVLIAGLWIVPASAVFIEFENCLSDATKNDLPKQLQLAPKFVDAVFNTTDPSHNLRVTVYTNVNGTYTPAIPLPPPEDTDYWNGNGTDRGGKIENIPLPDTANLITTIFNKVRVLTYQTWSQDIAFCSQVKNGTCPLGPRFGVNETDPYALASFGFSNNFYSTYAFTSFTTTILVMYGDRASTPIGCISAEITPDMGSTLTSIVKYIPLVILILVGAATAFAAIFSPWGTTDIFRWTTNYGRDPDLLRLVTPGFGDCLQYIQFVALTGGLTLNYPGFYQPITSTVSWSALMFNQSFVKDKTPYNSLVDGIYVTTGTYGLDRLRQLVGMGSVDDIWAGMMIWLLVILAIVVALIQVGFAVRWAFRRISRTQEEDLRAKNMPFSMGNVVRIVFNYFLLPIVALSMFQLVVTTRSPAYTVALAVVTLVVIIGFAGWLLYLIASTKPKAFLFDDLPTVLLYGSLYNTYSDHAAPFALIPVLLTFVRGIAIGAIQPSGIAQLVILAICEVITVITLHAFRPFHSPTSMNAYHTFFAVLRLGSILLMVSFAPSLGVTEGPKGWIGYAILLMHAVVLVFGFLLNAIQTIVEVAARMAGAGGDESGAARGGLAKVFGMRQLSRRLPRREAAASRQSQLSSAAMLSEHERKNYGMDGSGRIRSQSAGSTGVLLNRQSTGLDAGGVEPYGAPGGQAAGSGYSSFTPTTPGEASTFSFVPSAAAPPGLGRNRGTVLGINTADAADPYYRPPRIRRPTLEAYSPGARSRGSWTSGDWANKRWSQQEAGTPEQIETFEGPSISGRNTPVPQQVFDGSTGVPGHSQADYTTREVDFYYGVRGPALNANIPSRRIKTGPADPTGPAASAAGWFKGLFGGKTKEKGKGFEVVRSSRMPPGMQARNAPGAETPPEGIPVATGVVRNGPIESDDDEAVPKKAKKAGPSNTDGTSGRDGNLVAPQDSGDDLSDDDDPDRTRISDVPPVLPGIEIGESGIELPSRFPSKATSRGSVRRADIPDASLMPGLSSGAPSRQPTVPRRSSRRKSQSADLSHPGASFHQHHHQNSLDSTRLPFDRSNSKRQSTISTRSSILLDDVAHARDTSALGHHSADISNDRPASVGYVHQHNIRTITPIENPSLLGTSAEVVDGQRSGASSMEHQQR